MADHGSLSFEWNLENYEDLPDIARSPLFEFCDNKLQLSVRPHEHRPYIMLTCRAEPVRPLRLDVKLDMTQNGVSLKKQQAKLLFEWKSSVDVVDLPPKRTVVAGGNVLCIVVEISGAMRKKNGVVGELKKRERPTDTSSTTEPRAKRQRPLADDSAFLCTLCLDKQRDAVFKPCNHMGCCYVCASQLEHRRCPFCNEDFTECEQVYLP